MAERPPRESGETTSEVPPEIAEQVVYQFMDRQYRETLDQPVGMLGTKRHVRPQNQPLAGRRSPNGSNISKTNPQISRIPPIPWQPTVSSGCGTNSVSAICAGRTCLPYIRVPIMYRRRSVRLARPNPSAHRRRLAQRRTRTASAIQSPRRLNGRCWALTLEITRQEVVFEQGEADKQSIQ